MTSLGKELILNLLKLPPNQKKKLEIAQIKHGINSRVFRIKYGTKNIAVIKVYPPESATERLKAELSFLKFVGKIAPDKVPEVISSDFDTGVLATTYIPGRTRLLLKTGDLSQFINFQKKLDLYKNLPEASGLSLARDNVLSTQSIDQQIDRRLMSFYSMTMPNSYSHFINVEFPETKLEFVNKIFGKLHNGNTLADEVLQKKYQTPIASDFGLHNIICKPNGDFVFVDFEFAGWDDPCTLIANFVLHPGMSGQTKNREIFVREMLQHYSYIPHLEYRYRMRLPLFALRWALIVLRNPLMKYQNIEEGDAPTTSDLDQKLKLAKHYLYVAREFMQQLDL